MNLIILKEKLPLRKKQYQIWFKAIGIVSTLMDTTKGWINQLWKRSPQRFRGPYPFGEAILSFENIDWSKTDEPMNRTEINLTHFAECDFLPTIKRFFPIPLLLLMAGIYAIGIFF
ncbi:hypothetical protein [Peribacillus glennii]|uniref:Uncharacterized protein n=1 Tax=Peribacillus glennii TaxID=2303991 RepID=A0A372LEG3_9BACI|nr:hypothetical protein [Peribacillus glennii]RFU64695.1 hypothetical protein D0466_01845 [Peribacillus glennii]